MESNHLTNRTYTAPTCTLIVSSKDAPLDRRPNPVDFSLELERSVLGELDRVTLQGQPQQLDNLHQIVNKYIAELVAKFPLPSTDRQSVPEPDRSVATVDPTDLPLNNYLDPRIDDRDSRSGIIKNLPGLRGRLPQSPSPIIANPQPDFDDAKPSIANLLGRWHNPHRRDARPGDRIEQNLAAPATNSASEHPTTTPYLTGSEDRSVDHHLYLGDLATPASSEKLTLSAIQLFDLAAVLDEYAAEHVTTTDRSNLQGHGDRSQDAAPADISSRLPNLPKIPAQTEVGQAYYRTPRSRSASFMSGIPWAVAAALAVGVPLLLLDPNPNPLKDAASQLKQPDLAKTKKTTTATAPGASPPKSAPSSDATGIPAPWQAQPVQPPQNNTPVAPTNTPTPQAPGKIALAPLPDTILGAGGSTNSTIAPNPLTSELPGAGRSTSTATPTSGATSPRVAASTSKTPAASTGKTRVQIGQLPIDPSTAGKVSLSNQATLVPPSLPPNIAPSTPIPFDRSGLDEFGRIDPATRSLPKKTTQTVPPTPVRRPKPKPIASAPETGATPQPSFEPLTPVIKNPNLIDPNQSSPESTDPQAPPIVPNQPLQSNAGGTGADPADNPSLQESKRYFQGKWKASNAQSNALQYVLQVKGKSGTVQSIAPQGAEASTYLQQTKFIKPGQKLISPAAAGSSDQKIRVLLQPDGNVDTFIEP